jgi:hypothetical protein
MADPPLKSNAFQEILFKIDGTLIQRMILKPAHPETNQNKNCTQ